MHDVVIVGAGPAGSTAAYRLARAGVQVAVLDRATFPRAKACGGGLQAKVLRHLPVDVTPVIRSAMRGVCFSRKFRDRFTRYHREPIVYTTRRSDFDHFLLQQAIAQGAAFHEAVALTAFDQQQPGRVSLSTTRGPLACRVLIGADGANGVVRRVLNDEAAFFNQAGIYAELDRDRVEDNHLDVSVMRVDWGTLPSGYAWIFPKTDVVNVGAGAPVPIARHLRPYLAAFLGRERLLKIPGSDRAALPAVGHKLPTFTAKTTLLEGTVLVIGDAAGLIDPFTGDGISYGVHSANFAADAVLRWLNGDERALSDYVTEVRTEIAPEIRCARSLMTLFNMFPRMIHVVFKHDARMWEAFCRILRGEQSYDALRRMWLGPFSVVWRYLDRLTLAYETKRLRQARAVGTLL